MTYNDLPLVAFEYPDSETDVLAERKVRVTEVNSGYVNGYEVFRGYALPQPYKFKKYSLTRIAKGSVNLTEFSAPKPAAS